MSIAELLSTHLQQRVGEVLLEKGKRITKQLICRPYRVVKAEPHPHFPRSLPTDGAVSASAHTCMAWLIVRPKTPTKALCPGLFPWAVEKKERCTRSGGEFLTRQPPFQSTIAALHRVILALQMRNTGSVIKGNILSAVQISSSDVEGFGRETLSGYVHLLHLTVSFPSRTEEK